MYICPPTFTFKLTTPLIHSLHAAPHHHCSFLNISAGTSIMASNCCLMFALLIAQATNSKKQVTVASSSSPPTPLRDDALDALENDLVRLVPVSHDPPGPMPLPIISPDGRGAVIAHGTTPIPVGLYAMIFASYPSTGTTPPGAQDASCGQFRSTGATPLRSLHRGSLHRGVAPQGGRSTEGRSTGGRR